MIKFFKRKKNSLKNFFSAIYLLLDRMAKHHIFLIAAGIAFNIMIYLIPMFLIAIFVAYSIWDVDDISGIIQKFASDFLPPNDTTGTLLKETLEEVRKIYEKSSIFGWVGIVSLLWISSAMLSSIRAGLNAIFHSSSTKIFIIDRLRDILFSIILSALIFMSSLLFTTYATPLLSIIEGFVRENSPELVSALFSKTVIIAISLISSFILFFLLYRMVPNRKQPLGVTFPSALICVTLIETSRNVFAWYISSFAAYGKFYGAYAVVVAIAFWIYYMAFIILFSAEIGKFIHEVRKVSLR